MDVIEDFDQDDPERIYFGDDQRNWFKEQLMKPADLIFVVNGGPNFEPDYSYMSLSEFPAEKRKFIEVLRESGAEHVIFMAGTMTRMCLLKKCRFIISNVGFMGCDFIR
jgi:hypothetical protein